MEVLAGGEGPPERPRRRDGRPRAGLQAWLMRAAVGAGAVGALALALRPADGPRTPPEEPRVPAVALPAFPAQAGPASWAARGPRSGDAALLERARAAFRDWDTGGGLRPRLLWGGELPDGRRLAVLGVLRAADGPHVVATAVERERPPAPEARPSPMRLVEVDQVRDEATLVAALELDVDLGGRWVGLAAPGTGRLVLTTALPGRRPARALPRDTDGLAVYQLAPQQRVTAVAAAGGTPLREAGGRPGSRTVRPAPLPTALAALRPIRGVRGRVLGEEQLRWDDTTVCSVGVDVARRATDDESATCAPLPAPAARVVTEPVGLVPVATARLVVEGSAGSRTDVVPVPLRDTGWAGWLVPYDDLLGEVAAVTAYDAAGRVLAALVLPPEGSPAGSR